MTRRLDPAAPDFSGLIRPGDHILWGQVSAEPPSLVEALVAQRAQLGPLSLFLGTGLSRTLQPMHADHLRFSGLGGLGTMRALASAGLLAVLPMHGGQVHRHLAEGRIRCDVVLLMLGPADAQGQHSLGCVVDYLDAALAVARVVIAEISPHVPFTLGHATIPAARLDAVLETDRAPLGTKAAGLTARDREIGAHLAGFIPDCATIQTGLGALPEAILAALMDHRHLGLHSGIMGDAALALIECGALTNERKPIDTGRSVTTTLVGGPSLYAHAHRNPAILLRPSAYTHAETVLAQIPRLVALNGALEVDLSGQVNAEQVGGAIIGGVGGQADFARAAARSQGGLSGIALHATASDGASRIVRRLSGPTTTPRADVDLVATEFGVADLRGVGLAERARRLTAIATPQARERLQFERGIPT